MAYSARCQKQSLRADNTVTHQLLLSEEEEVANDDDDLADESEPELPVNERVVLARRRVPDGRVGEHVARSDLVGRGASSQHDDARAKKLGSGQGRADMQTR
jgi:hypothetical protein